MIENAFFRAFEFQKKKTRTTAKIHFKKPLGLGVDPTFLIFSAKEDPCLLIHFLVGIFGGGCPIKLVINTESLRSKNKKMA
jgi:hypothetical protein